jgi:hypothetical protein
MNLRRYPNHEFAAKGAGGNRFRDGLLVSLEIGDPHVSHALGSSQIAEIYPIYLIIEL